MALLDESLDMFMENSVILKDDSLLHCLLDGLLVFLHCCRNRIKTWSNSIDGVQLLYRFKHGLSVNGGRLFPGPLRLSADPAVQGVVDEGVSLQSRPGVRHAVCFLVESGDGLDVHCLRHVDERVGRARRQTCPLLDKLVRKSVEFLEVGLFTFSTTFILITKLKSLSVLYLSFCQSVCISVFLSF